MKSTFPPLHMLEAMAEEDAAHKTKRLARLYHLTQQHAWDGKALLGALIDKHGPPGAGMSEAKRQALSRVLTIVMWGELAAWNISADLALRIDDLDAKLAATGQVFADQMSETWLAFARTGDPNNASIPHWAPYDLARRATLVFDVQSRAVDDYRSAERVLLARVFR
jgi:hypothetical protein